MDVEGMGEVSTGECEGEGPKEDENETPIKCRRKKTIVEILYESSLRLCHSLTELEEKHNARLPDDIDDAHLKLMIAITGFEQIYQDLAQGHPL